MTASSDVPRDASPGAGWRRACAAAMVLVLAGCQGPYLTEEKYYVDPPPAPLTGKEIEAAVTGNSVVSDAPTGPFVVYFLDTGEILGRQSNHYLDRGRWRVTETELCVRWDNWWSNSERCWQVTRTGETVTWQAPYAQASGESARMVAGNWAGLK